MMYSSISSKSVIQRLISRYGVTISKNDAIEWIGDAIEEIGYHVGFFNKIEKVNVINYKIQIPCDFISLNYFVYNGRKLIYGVVNTKPLPLYQLSAEQEEVVAISNLNFDLKLNDCCIDADQEEKEYHIENYNKRIDYLNSELKQRQVHQDYYYTNSGQGYGTNAHGHVYMFYKAFPLDDEGYPLIINEIKYKNAIMKYVLMCLLSSGYKHPVLDYPNALNESDIAIRKAANEHFKMTSEQMESFAGHWTDLLYRIKDNNNTYSNA